MSVTGSSRSLSGLHVAFRPLTQADLPEMLEIERQAHSHPWSETVFRDCFRDNYRSWGLLMERVLAGYAIVSYLVDEAHLLNICVAPGWQRLGGGRRLLRHAVTQARSDGMVRMLLEVRAGNTPARELYTREGFHEIGWRRGYYPGSRGREDAVVMALSLVDSSRAST